MYKESDRLDPSSYRWRERLHEIIFEADTPAGRLFDVGLMVAIVASVVLVMFESVRGGATDWGPVRIAEWTFTALFTIEYVLRVVSVRRPLAYMTSFFGIVDLLAILPAYLDFFLPGGHYLAVFRILRLLRVFRVLRLTQFMGEAELLAVALRSSRAKIFVFLYTIVTLVVIVGTLIYLIEGGTNGFTSIPRSMYWAVVTMTTVGYGDIAPQTNLGQVLASIVMIIGYGIIAVPAGIVTAEITSAVRARPPLSTQSCPHCGAEGHAIDAQFCRRCGNPL